MKININHCINIDDIVKKIEELQCKDIIDMYGIPIISVLQDTVELLLYFEKELDLCKRKLSKEVAESRIEKGSDALEENLERYKAAFLKANREKRKAKKHEEDILCEIAPILVKERLSFPNCFGKGACSSGCECVVECKKACDCDYEDLSLLALYKIYEIKNKKILYGKTKSEILEELKKK